MTSRSHIRGPLTGWHVLAILMVFFGIVFTVNGMMAYSALSTYSGDVAMEPYRKGLAYNRRIAADEKQQARQWHEMLDLTADGHVQVAVIDHNGAPVTGMNMSAELGRGASDRFDHTLKLREIEPGKYAADGGKLETGSWIVSIAGKSTDGDDQTIYRLRRRLWLKP